MTKTTRVFKAVPIEDNEDATSKLHKTKENFRRKSLSTYTPHPGTFRPINKHTKALVEHLVEIRLRHNLAQGRNKGHHQQQEFNRTGKVIPA